MKLNVPAQELSWHGGLRTNASSLSPVAISLRYTPGFTRGGYATRARKPPARAPPSYRSYDNPKRSDAYGMPVSKTLTTIAGCWSTAVESRNTPVN